MDQKQTTFFDCGRFRFSREEMARRPLVMGILNVTPDSFSDGGRFGSLESAISHAEQMIADGVDIIDIGGESTRPGAQALDAASELRRVLPVIYALRDCGKPLSIDTCKPVVMREAIVAGVDMLNDITGFGSPEAIALAAAGECGICVMHMQRDPQTMQLDPRYGDVVAEVGDHLGRRVEALERAGVARNRLCIDPGFGFGKNLSHNIELLKHIGRLATESGLPVLAGLSRKSMIGGLTGRPVEDRLAGSIAAALAAAGNGATILRVHDVAETVDALKVWQALA